MSRTNKNGVAYTRAIAVSAMLGAVAFVLMFFDFAVPFMPPFIKMDISDLPELLASFALGPVWGVAVTFLKILLKLIFKGTSTAYAGELCNFLLGAAFSITAGAIYHGGKTRTRAVVAAVAGAAVMALVSVPANYFITYPAYETWYHMTRETIISLYQVILPSVNSLLECLVIFNMPFTLIKGLLCALVCFLIYKPLSPVLHGRR